MTFLRLGRPEGGRPGGPSGRAGRRSRGAAGGFGVCRGGGGEVAIELVQAPAHGAWSAANSASWSPGVRGRAARGSSR